MNRIYSHIVYTGDSGWKKEKILFCILKNIFDQNNLHDIVYIFNSRVSSVHSIFVVLEYIIT